MQTPTPHINARDRLIVALDLESAEHAQAMVDALEGVVDFFKIGLSLQLAPGVEALIRSLIKDRDMIRRSSWTTSTMILHQRFQRQYRGRQTLAFPS